MKKMLFSIVLIASVFAQASLLTFADGTKQLEGVVLHPSAKINDEKGQPTALSMDLLGAGLRSKTVLFVAAKVYVAQMFSDSKATFARTTNDALSTLVKNSKFVAMKMTMKRNVSASTLAVSFREAIEANDYTIDTELEQMLKLVETSADGAQGKSLTMLMVRNATGGTNVYYEDVNGTQKSLAGSAEMMTKVMSIWLGKSADPGLEELKASLLKPVY